MTFTARLTGPATRDVARLPQRIALAVLAYVDDRLIADPLRRTKPLRGELAHRRSARVGDYRLLVTVDQEQFVVVIHRVNHRAHLYRPPG